MRKSALIVLLFAAGTLTSACHNDAKQNEINSAESERDFPDAADTVVTIDTIGITADTSLTQ